MPYEDTSPASTVQTVTHCDDPIEDLDGYEDEDGCADPDNDQDGLADRQDRCPNDPESDNGFEDEDGCPDRGCGCKILVDGGPCEFWYEMN